jgi:hypothetical protein
MSAIIELELPGLSELGPEPELPGELYERRQVDLRRRMREAGLDVLAIYADREHFASSNYLTGFDPRFEEALVILDGESVWILAGNESISLIEGLPGEVSGVLCQEFSLPGQDRSLCPTVAESLVATGLPRSATVGVVGWKPMRPGRVAVPEFVLAGLEEYFTSSWRDVTDWLGGVSGARADVGPDQLALHEHRATRASEHVWWALEALAVGMTELEISRAMRLTGLPLSCHVMCSSGTGSVMGLRSPTDRVVARGDLLSLAVGLQGGLASRAGRLVTHDELGVQAQVDRVSGPYMGAQRLWYESLRIGADTGVITAAISEHLAKHGLSQALNPGHFIDLDEWLDSPFVPDSTMKLSSGMALQCDILPVSPDPVDFVNCEDSLALAGEELRAELAGRFPEMWARVCARRQFMAESLDIELSEEVLPFSERPATLPAGLLSIGYAVMPERS